MHPLDVLAFVEDGYYSKGHHDPEAFMRELHEEHHQDDDDGLAADARTEHDDPDVPLPFVRCCAHRTKTVRQWWAYHVPTGPDGDYDGYVWFMYEVDGPGKPGVYPVTTVGY